jgi:cytochrome P450
MGNSPGSATGVRAEVDLADPELYRSGAPEAVWASLRATTPVYRNGRGDDAFWAVLSHDLISRTLRDHSTFVSRHGMRLDQNPAATAAAAGKMLIITDPPRHTQIRRIINSAFTPRVVARLEENMRGTVTEVLDRALEEGECDFTRVASVLPVSVICDMLGVPKSDWEFLLDRTMVAFGADAGQRGPLAAAEAHADILGYYAEMVDERRKTPREDLVTALVQGTVEGRPLTDEEIFLNCDGLISGGNETTRHATVGGLLALIDHPDQWRRLREDQDLLPGTVQEILRHTAPAMHVLRTASTATELGGQKIAAGDRVALWLPSGNRDEAVFRDPERFDVSRSPNPHLTFAAGAHYCLGSALAVKELTVFFDELTRRVADVTQTSPPRRMASVLIRGYESAPVRLTPR